MNNVTNPTKPERLAPGRTLFRLKRDPLRFLQTLANKHGDAAHIQIGLQNFYLLNHPDYIKEVLLTQDRAFMKGAALQRTKRLLGEGLLTSEGEFHLRQRRIIQPLFHHERLAQYGSVIADLAERASVWWNDGADIDIAKEMSLLTLAITGKTLFGVDVNDVAGEIGKALTAMLDTFAILVSPLGDFLMKLPFPRLIRAKRAQELLDRIIYRVIEEARASGGSETLVSLLLQARDEDGNGMTDQQVRDEAMTLFLAGFETTANTMTWTWHLLSQNPETEAKLHTEIDTVLGGRLPKVDDLQRLTYTQMVLSESMRLFPPAWVVGRRALKDIQIGDLQIPEGSIVAVSQYVMHRDPRYYPEPERFDPERWTPEARATRPNYSYFPFGAGSRVCIGKHLAQMEAALILATIAGHWSLNAVAGHRVRTQPVITLRPKNGLRMKLHRRYAR